MLNRRVRGERERERKEAQMSGVINSVRCLEPGSTWRVLSIVFWKLFNGETFECYCHTIV